MNVLVTGGSGFIGRHCLEELQRTGATIHCLSRKLPSESLRLGVHWHTVDLLARPDLGQLFGQIRPTHLLHLAWCATPGTYLKDEQNYDWVSATVDLARAFRASGGSRIVSAGTCAEYDWTSGVCTEQDALPDPQLPYPACKSGLQKLLCGMTGLSVAWTRLFFVYGPGEHPDKLVSSSVAAFRSSRTPRLEDPSAVRDFIYVKDVAAGLIGLLSSRLQGPVNISSGVGTSVGCVVETVGRLLGVTRITNLSGDGEPSSFCVGSNRLMHDVTGWAPNYTVETALKEMVSLEGRGAKA